LKIRGKINQRQLTLIAVEGPGIQGQTEQFSLLFRGPLETPFEQGTQEVRHDALGTFYLFLVPIGREADGMRYESAFNNIVD
jgi:hypothetical protein